MIRVRRIRSDEAGTHMNVRLAALTDSPAAFASRYDAEARFASEVWEQRTELAASGAQSAIFLAFDDEDQPVGMVAAIENISDQTTAELVSMWVAPSSRREGTGAALVGDAVAWAEQSGFLRIELWVARGNDSAERLYRRLGFDVTGDVKPLPSDPCKDEIRMRLEF